MPDSTSEKSLSFDESACFSREPNPYLAAWTRGACLAGSYLFSSDLRPNVRLIQRAIGPKSPAERFFLAALVSFHSTKDGSRLLTSVGFHGFADFGRLDLSRRAVVADLVFHLQARCNLSSTDAIGAEPIRSIPTREQSPWDALLREERHFTKAPEVFLSAWKCGAGLAGPNLFGSSASTDIASAQTKWDLCPKVPLIARAIESMSNSDGLFLASLVSFYNSEDGGVLLRHAGFQGLADLSRLDRSRRAVIAGLILNYTGW